MHFRWWDVLVGKKNPVQPPFAVVDRPQASDDANEQPLLIINSPADPL
jgi:hypothetical protein